MKNRGFTLIELLIVVAIIGILFSVVIQSYKQAKNKTVKQTETCNSTCQKFKK